MKVALIGVGQAGGKLAQALAEYDQRLGGEAIRGAIAVNTAQNDLQGIDIEPVLIGQDRVKGQGVGGDNELGAEIMQSDANEVMGALDGTLTADVEAILVIAGLGGGTGSGGAPVLINELKQIYDRPVYGLGILPGRDEGAMYLANAGRSLKTLIREADSTLLIDNDAWRASGESVRAAFDAINERIARRVGLLLAAGEGIEGVGESVVDSSEIINTLRNGGIAALGYANAVASEEAEENIHAVMSITRQALRSNMSLPDTTEAGAALIVIAGKPEIIPRRGVERARRWLEEETGSLEVRGGDYPLDSERIGALVLLSGLERGDAIEEFLEIANQAQEEAESARPDPAEAFHNEEIEDLF
ncbi:MAG: tubulin/FtsZ family protein [Halobacteriales archaeon]|nr:tubulin/FtsZ family protein [Halobacteriales archaeon]